MRFLSISDDNFDKEKHLPQSINAYKVKLQDWSELSSPSTRPQGIMFLEFVIDEHQSVESQTVDSLTMLLHRWYRYSPVCNMRIPEYHSNRMMELPKLPETVVSIAVSCNSSCPGSVRAGKEDC